MLFHFVIYSLVKQHIRLSFCRTLRLVWHLKYRSSKLYKSLAAPWRGKGRKKKNLLMSSVSGMSPPSPPSILFPFPPNQASRHTNTPGSLAPHRAHLAPPCRRENLGAVLGLSVIIGKESPEYPCHATLHLEIL